MLVRRPRGASTGGGGGGLARLAEARLELCPIDHGFCLPEGLEPPYFEWLHWPQVCCVRSRSLCMEGCDPGLLPVSRRLTCPMPAAAGQGCCCTLVCQCCRAGF